MYTFEENLNFIFNFNHKINSDFFEDTKYIENYLKKALKFFSKDNESKSIKEVINIQKITKMFIKKAKNYMDRRVFINNEAKKLLNEWDDSLVIMNRQLMNRLTQKSDILADKLKYKKVEMEFIENFVKKTKQSLEKLDALGDDFDSKRVVLDALKGILKETEKYNIGRLKRAQQKFEKSKELNDFMYGKRNPKLAHLLSLDSSVPVDSATPSKLMTPFGPVWVKKGEKGDRIIYNDELTTEALNYDSMCKNLDGVIEDIHNEGILYKIQVSNVISLIEPVIKYINQPLTIRQNNTSIRKDIYPEELFNTIRSNFQINERILSDKQKKAAAFLCGVLLLSESHEFRNPTGGKFERKAMKNVLRLAKNNCLNPFAVVFNRAKGRYIPAHDKRSLKKISPNKNKNATTGGVKQTIRALDEHNIPMEALIQNGKSVEGYWAGRIDSYLSTKKLNTKLKKPISDTNQTPSTKPVTAADIIKDLNSESKEVPIYLTKDYYNTVNKNIKPPTITKDIIDDLRKLAQFSKMTNNATIDIDSIPEVIRSDIKTEINRNKKLINKLMNNSLH